jgi:hypothetical protein
MDKYFTPYPILSSRWWIPSTILCIPLRRNGRYTSTVYYWKLKLKQLFISVVLSFSLLLGPSVVPPSIPVQWYITDPLYPHLFPDFYGPDNKAPIPCPLPPRHTYTNVQKHFNFMKVHRVHDFEMCSCQGRAQACLPPWLFPSLIAAVNGTLLQNCYPREISILQLHGSAYGRATPPNSNLDSPLLPIYPRLNDGRILVGGMAWGGFSPPSQYPPLPCNPRIVSAALKALARNAYADTLTFGRCVVENFTEYLSCALAPMEDLCLYNRSLVALAFPRSPVNPLPPLALPTWESISSAICRNPAPSFRALDFTGCYLGDVCASILCPALMHLFASRISLISLRFDENNLTEKGVQMILDAILTPSASKQNYVSLVELSFGSNPWNGNPALAPVAALSALLSLSPSLRFLNLESTNGVFPVASIIPALTSSGCPLECLRLGGSAVDPAQVSMLVSK